MRMYVYVCVCGGGPVCGPVCGRVCVRVCVCMIVGVGT